jgi:copper resistance protein B
LDGDTERAEVQLLYSRAIDTNWDLHVGWRHDAKPEPTRDWFAIGFYGLAPYFIEVDSALFIKEGDHVNLRIEAGLRLRYEITRQFAPYIGINYEQLLGDTRDMARDRGVDSSDTQAVAGLRFWF